VNERAESDVPIPMDSGAVPLDCPGVDNCPPSSHLHVRVARLQESVEALSATQLRQADELRGIAAGHIYLADQITELGAKVGAQAGASKVLADGLDANTRMTREVLDMTKGISDILAAGRVAGHAVTWVGSFAKPLAWLLLSGAAALSLVRGYAVEVWHGFVDVVQMVVPKK